VFYSGFGGTLQRFAEATTKYNNDISGTNNYTTINIKPFILGMGVANSIVPAILAMYYACVACRFSNQY
jgi:hypothetical protein